MNGSLSDAPARGLQTALVTPGPAAVIEFKSSCARWTIRQLIPRKGLWETSM